MSTNVKDAIATAATIDPKVLHLVDRAVRLAKKHGALQWELGDVLLQLAPMQPRGGRRGTHVYLLLELVAQKSDYSVDALRTLRMVAYRWPPPERLSGVSFDLHRLFSSPQARKEVLQQWAMTPDRKPEALEEYMRPSSRIHRMSHQDKVSFSNISRAAAAVLMTLRDDSQSADIRVIEALAILEPWADRLGRLV